MRPARSSSRKCSHVAQRPTRLLFASSTRGASAVRAEDGHRLAALHQQRLVVTERQERAHDRIEGLPRSGGPAGAAVDHQVLRPLRDVRIEVVEQHPQRRLLLPATAVQRGAARGAHGAGSVSVQDVGHVLGQAGAHDASSNGAAAAAPSSASLNWPAATAAASVAMSGLSTRSAPSDGTRARTRSCAAAACTPARRGRR